eukprot:COSAG01_NODE_373_length_17991_cov_284.890075_2_plen_123_part_00
MLGSEIDAVAVQQGGDGGDDGGGGSSSDEEAEPLFAAAPAPAAPAPRCAQCPAPPEDISAPDWRAVHALPEARRPNARQETAHPASPELYPTPAAASCNHIDIRTNHSMNRNVGESQSLLRF